ncbi:hypothetical protein MHB77_32415 [Paenibacillus sp. FSL K6-3166]|uniref:hypothetical protein n=1 Tax=unclassified Paenibacillus TaxID=185978 RepID=UPI000BA014C5|nr:hypothetical protein [Paenibacillus sp. VTT E-133291]OZQ84694.1 hypothetical protein CA598_23150 [Paenibacillus sp. VTT E-133291]
MREYVGYSHVSDYTPEFAEKANTSIRHWADLGYDVEIHYAQSTEPCGRVLFSVMVTAWTAQT